MTRLRRCRTAVLLCLEVLVLLELTLQGLSWLHFIRLKQSHERQVASINAAAQHVVLCVGDSFTFGEGASSMDHAYPVVLEALLNAGTPPAMSWTVLNFGKPGRNSWEVVQFLGGWLRRVAPTYLVLLVGQNDAWNDSFSDLVPAAFSQQREAATPLVQWQWTFRTGRLAKLLAYGLSRMHDQPHEAPPRQRVSVQQTPARVQAPIDSSVAHRPLAQEQTPGELRVLASRLLLTGEDYHGAEIAYRALLARVPGEISSQIALGRALLAQHKLAEGLLVADAARGQVLAVWHGPPDVMTQLGWLYVDLGDRSIAQRLGEESLRRYPEYLPAFQLLIQIAILASHEDVASAYLDRVLPLITPDDPFRAELLMQRALVKMTTQETVPEAYRDLLTAYRLSRNRDALYQPLRHLIFRHPIEPVTWTQQLAASALSTDDVRRLQELVEEVQASRTRGSFPKLKTNLQLVEEICAKHGTQLIVLNYPSRTALPEYNAIIQAFAEETATPFVDLERRFSDVVRTQQVDYDALLVKDAIPMTWAIKRWRIWSPTRCALWKPPMGSARTLRACTRPGRCNAQRPRSSEVVEGRRDGLWRAGEGLLQIDRIGSVYRVSPYTAPGQRFAVVGPVLIWRLRRCERMISPRHSIGEIDSQSAESTIVGHDQVVSSFTLVEVRVRG